MGLSRVGHYFKWKRGCKLQKLLVRIASRSGKSWTELTSVSLLLCEINFSDCLQGALPRVLKHFFFFFYLFCQRGLASYIKPDCHKIKSKTHNKGFSSLLPFISSSAHQKQTTQKKNRPRELVAGILSCLSPKFEQLFARQSVEICSNHEDSLSHNKNTLHKELSGLQTFSYCSRNILTLLLCQIPAGFHLCWISSLGKP